MHSANNDYPILSSHGIKTGKSLKSFPFYALSHNFSYSHARSLKQPSGVKFSV